MENVAAKITKKLTAKQEMFVREYLIDLNATQAAIRAGYNSKTAYSQGQRLLKKVEIQAAIQAAIEKRAKRKQMEADEVLETYAKLARAEITDYLTVQTERVIVGRTEEGEPISEIRQIVLLKDTADIPKDKIAAIQSVEINKDGEIKFKLHDKKGALDSLAKHLGMFVEKHELTGKDGRPIMVKHSGLAAGMTKEELQALLKERKEQDARNGSCNG